MLCYFRTKISNFARTACLYYVVWITLIVKFAPTFTRVEMANRELSNYKLRNHVGAETTVALIKIQIYLHIERNFKNS